MKTAFGHLTYCSNIHAGESWAEHFEKLKTFVPAIKKQCSPENPFALGLRLSDTASSSLENPDNLAIFMNWLQENDLYVFTMNGFPFGNFHHARVKDQVHAPDWLTQQRVDYTLRLAEILSVLLPQQLEGGISTSPLTYRHWHQKEEWDSVFRIATSNLLQVVERLIRIREESGKLIHIDIEPEPDGLLDNGTDFLNWYEHYLLPLGKTYLGERLSLSSEQAEAAIKAHVQLCYDVCHFAVGYENHAVMINRFEQAGINIGKIQISAALKGQLNNDAVPREQVLEAFEKFNEPVYLHQVIALQQNGSLLRYPDMPDALTDGQNPAVLEWRAHYHVPIFIDQYNILQSTREDIKTVLTIHKNKPFTNHLEVETYTWEVLPVEMRVPIEQSIARELQWVLDTLQDPQSIQDA